MGIRAILSKPLAAYVVGQQRKWAFQPYQTQQKVFKQLIDGGKNTKFGKDHNFDLIKNYEDFKRNVPVRDYEDLKTYIEKILQGESDVLWPGKPAYLE